MDILRAELYRSAIRSLRNNPVTALLGPRQCGKTTLARDIAESLKANYFDLEDPISLRRLAEPMITLQPMRGLVVIDEIQRLPEFFPLLRVLSDRKPLPARFLILGSASPELIRQSSESLAGRIGFVEMSGFDLAEAKNWKRLWWRGGFPRAYVAKSDADSLSWRSNFIRTFLEKDIREFGVGIPAQTLRRLWMMIAHYHGQVFNASEVGRSLGDSHTTIKRHLDLLTGTLMVRQLQPWFENVGKRQIKSVKVYVRDTGLLHSLLEVSSLASFQGHPKVGASWEGFVVEEAIRQLGERNCYFWATQSGAEVDLLYSRGSRRFGIDAKYSDAPGPTKSMRIAMQDLKLSRLFIVYPGSQAYDIDSTIRVIPITQLRQELEPWQ